MSDLYWLCILGNLHSLGAGIALISFLAMILLSFILVTTTLDDYDKPPICLKILKLSAVSTLLVFLMYLYIPSTKSLLIFY